MIQLDINYDNNTINVKEGNNFRINLVSSLFKKGDVVTVNHQGKNQQYQLQKDKNYAKNNMKLYCDPNFGYDSYINIGDFAQEVNLAYVPKPANAVAAPQAQPAKPPQPKKQEPPKPAHKPAPAKIVQAKIIHPQLPNVDKPTQNGRNPAQYIDKSRNGMPYMCVKLAETEFAWTNQAVYWKKVNHSQALMGKQIYHLNKVFYLNPKAQFFDVPKAKYFLLLRHNPCHSEGLHTCKLTVKVDDKQIFAKNFFSKNYRALKNKKNLYDEFVTNIDENAFNNSNNHEVCVEVIGENNVKKEWDLDGFILIPDNCDGQIEKIYNQYFNVGLLK